MRTRNGTVHSSDENLLAHLDGELAERQRRRTAQHLKVCWECRARLAELESQVEALARAQSERNFLGRARAQAALARFLEWEEQFEAGRRRGRFSATIWRSALRVAAVLAILAAGLGYWEFGRRNRQRTEALLWQVQTADQAFTSRQAVVHQVFRVEVAQTRPHPTERRSRMEVWSEASTGRLAFHWNDQDGRLKEAVWRKEARREHRYSPEAAPKLVVREARTGQPVSLGDLSQHGVDPERIENGVLAWLESRQWLPVGVAADLVAFRSRGGAVLTAERARSGDGQSVIRFRARGRSFGADVELTVEVDAASSRVRWQRARYETPERAVELRLISELAELVPAASLRPQVFASPAIAPARPRPPVLTGRERPAEPARSSLVDSRVADSAELDAAEVEALWLLHRIGACMGEVTEVAPEPPARLRIRALVRTEERKTSLVAAFADLRTRWDVLLEVHTVGGAAATAAPGYRKSPAAAGSDPGGHAVRALQDTLALHLFQRQGYKDRALADQKARELAKAGQVASSAAFAEGWALVRLAERFDPDRIAKLTPPARRMLEQMVCHHATALRSHLDRTRETLGPLLTSGSRPAEPSQPAASWTEATFALFDAIARLDDLVQEASTDAPAGPAYALLFSGLAPLIHAAEAGLTRFDAAVANQFAASREFVSGATEPR